MFYFVSYALTKRDEDRNIYYDFCSTCVEEHPFKWLANFDKDDNKEKVIIIYFKEITQTDYKMFHS